MKKYFLFFASHPVWYSFLLTIALLLIFIIPSSDRGMVLLGAAIFFIFHVVLVYAVIFKFITSHDFEPMDNDYWEHYFFDIVSFPDGRKVITKKPVWGKGRLSGVGLGWSGNGDSAWRASVCEEQLIVPCNLDLVQGYFKVSVPVIITLSWDKPFKEDELFEKFKTDKNLDHGTEVNVSTLVQDLFGKLNKADSPVFLEALTDLHDGKISNLIFQESILKHLVFPDKLFSNITDTNLCVGAPEGKTCWGLSCGQKNLQATK